MRRKADSLQAKFELAMQRHVSEGFDPNLAIEAAMFEVLKDSGKAAGKTTDPRDEEARP